MYSCIGLHTYLTQKCDLTFVVRRTYHNAQTRTRTHAHTHTHTVPPPTVMLTEQSQTLYANVSNQIFTCQVSLAANVDTDVQVNINWVRTLFNGDENKSADSIRLNGSLSNRMGMSMLELQDLSSKDDNVSCTAILIPLDDTFLKASDGINKTINLTVEGE